MIGARTLAVSIFRFYFYERQNVIKTTKYDCFLHWNATLYKNLFYFIRILQNTLHVCEISPGYSIC
ncbi:conserved hypothetical protein [Thiomonas arsenitoxydans]|uniref:Uncharacterized protein n=1 Tax=Thiomonas arsenitoxydans (strain DSM 22701 / CIP 110005 / 3As) TaxID=426114 RepID=D6CTB4_THIA3|nr:hypothetical protein THI_1868 [Thiomonas arsenitoxydans]CQR27530.1 conserved hypothetical protein [Thiomonas arsenitoxydans]CQR32410.1 conserved hypothetical protein [Thiomonas arsenitoxydans]CQR34398.1 conserved hypothetical protein [Thiomonas arsenitoxydans]CQR34478.1 conserved hypothetical protein [Thiomonas arsenitoxydans]